MHKRMQFNAYIYIFYFLKPILYLNIVFFIQIFFYKLIQWKQNRPFYVSCVFAKQNRAWKNNNYIDFLFENVFKFYYKKKNHIFIHKIN